MSSTERPSVKHYASIIVLPPRSNDPLNIHVPAWAYYLLVAAIPALIVLVAGSLVLSGWMAFQLRDHRTLKAHNLELEARNAKIEQLEHDLRQFEDFRLRVLDLLGADVRDAIDARVAESLYMPSSGVADSLVGPPVRSSSPEADRLGSLPSSWPVEGVISKDFVPDGPRASVHYGIDIAAPHRAEVRASGAGTIAFAGRDSVFGELVIIDHGKDVFSYYGHNSILEVGQGDHVTRGQVIARVGSTGESSGPHVHFEVRRQGVPINPRAYLVD